MSMWDLDAEMLSEYEHQERERDDAHWAALISTQQTAQPQKPEDTEPNVIRRFLEGVTKGMRGTPNVFRPEGPVEGQGPGLERIGEAAALPFTMAFNAITQGLIEAGVINPGTQEELGKIVVGALPALTAPRQPMAPGAVKEVLRGGKRGAVRVPGAPEPPPAEPVPPATSTPTEVVPPTGEPRINVARVGGEESVGRTMQAVNAAFAERMAEHRKTVTHEKTIAEARGKLTVEQALAIPPETWGKLAPEETALRDLSNTASKHLDSLIKAANAGDAQALADLPSAFTLAGELTIRDEALGRNIARGLEARKILSEAERAPIAGSDISALTERLQGAGITPEILLERLNILRTQAERQTMTRQTVEAARLGSDIFHEIYISGLVSGPRTQASNILANALLVPWETAERTVAALMPGGGSERISLREPAAMIGGLLDGYQEGIRLAGKVLKGEEVGTMKLEGRKPAIAASRFGLEDTFVGHAIDGLGSFIRLPFLGLSTADAFFKGLNFRIEVKALATREALAEGLRGKALTERAKYIDEHLVEFPTIKASAEEFALAQTLQRDFGPISRAISNLRNSTPGGKVLVPFLQVSANSLSWTAERIPGLNLPSVVAGRLGAEFRAGGPARQQALAKIATGAMVSALIARLVLSGQVTGQGPQDKDQRSMKYNTGWRPYSVKIGDDYYEYRRLAPIGQMIGIVADFTEIAGELPEYQADALATAIALSAGKNALNQTWMRTAADLLEAIEDPAGRASAFAQSLARSVVPTAVREMERQTDPELREVRTWLDAIRESIPDYSATLPPRRNLFGDSILTPEGWGPDWLSPISTSTDKPDIVAKEMDRLKLGIGMPSKVIYGKREPGVRLEPPNPKEGIELTPQEYDILVRWAGNEMKVNGKGMKDRLRDLITSESYQTHSDMRREIEIRKIVTEYREGAEDKLLSKDHLLRELVEQKLRMRGELLRQRTPAVSMGR